MRHSLKALLFLFAFAVISGFSDQRSTRDEDTVPPELGKEPTTILLLETPRNKVNKDMQQAFEKYYSGTVEMIPEAMLKSGQYKDIKKYRYYLETGIEFVEARGMGSNRQPATFNYSYSLKDRQTGLSYGPSNSSDAWLSLLKRYIKKMEEVRKSNEVK